MWCINRISYRFYNLHGFAPIQPQEHKSSLEVMSHWTFTPEMLNIFFCKKLEELVFFVVVEHLSSSSVFNFNNVVM